MLQSETSGRFYIGQTQDVAERLAYHNANYSKSLKNWVLGFFSTAKRFLLVRPQFSANAK
jgi:predicted GIY-YIG superfamily endonuclease